MHSRLSTAISSVAWKTSYPQKTEYYICCENSW